MNSPDLRIAYYADSNRELRALVREHIEQQGPTCSLNHIDVRGVTDFNGIFAKLDFRGDISKWDVSKATLMDGMFRECTFNGNISRWKTSNVISMYQMFKESHFNGNIAKWDVSNVEHMGEMFASSKFQGDLSSWKPSKLRQAFYMFEHSAFRGSIGHWDIPYLLDQQETTCMFSGLDDATNLLTHQFKPGERIGALALGEAIVQRRFTGMAAVDDQLKLLYGLDAFDGKSLRESAEIVMALMGPPLPSIETAMDFSAP